MAKPHLGPLKPFSTIGALERLNVIDALRRGPLSGYIGGDPKAGYWVSRLAEEWSEFFDVPHTIPCNSATSGLLAACMALRIGPETMVWTTPYSMSATAACAKVLGAIVRYIDIDTERFSLPPLADGGALPQVVILTNLFGHPAHLKAWREWCDRNHVKMIEDNAQAPMATEGGRYAGTIGHIGVFSLNVHKHIQCGEGGVIVTSDDELAARLAGVINHGELSFEHRITGLNLRMAEPTAAIACAQLHKAEPVIRERRDIGLELCDMVRDVSWIKAHTDQPGCRHVYYLWTALANSSLLAGLFVGALQGYGVPIRRSYAPLLHKLFKSWDQCPVVEDVDSRIVVFEVCAYDLPKGRRDTLREIFKRVTGELHEDEAA